MIYFTDGQYLAALKRMRARIAGGLRLTAEDSETIGDKYTHCTWGLCSSDKEQWLPGEPKYRDDSRQQRCPIDARQEPPQPFRAGCFYTCRIFKARGNLPRRDTVLRWYDEQIQRMEQS